MEQAREELTNQTQKQARYIPRLWLWWVLACTLGGVIDLASCGIPSIVLGVTQWLILRLFINRAGWWILATIIGSFLASLLIAAFSPTQITDQADLAVIGRFSVVGAGLGVLVGLTQWAVLRQQVPKAGWWIAASAVGWSAGSLVAVFVLSFLPFISSQIADQRIMLFVLGMAIGVPRFVLIGVITGLALTWLLKGRTSSPTY